MANIYQNPTTNLPTGGLTWVPNQIPTGDGGVFGFNAETLERGKFRNDLPDNIPGVNYTTLNPTVHALTPNAVPDFGTASSNWPFLASFRTLTAPYVNLGSPPTLPCAINSNDVMYQINLLDTPSPISTLVISYSLTVDITDNSFLSFLNEQDQKAVIAYLGSNSNGVIPTIDWNNYPWVKLVGLTASDITSGNSGTEYPILSNNFISTIKVTNSGSNFTSLPNVVFTTSLGAGASATANLGVVAVKLSGTINYKTPPKISFSGGGATTQATGHATLTKGVLTIIIDNPGSGYTSVPLVTFSAGTAIGTAVLGVESITINNGGNGYAFAPLVTITGGGGVGAAATCTTAFTQQVSVTDFEPSNNSPKSISLTVNLLSGGNIHLPDNYPRIRRFEFINRHNINSLKLRLNKIQLFNASRVNISNNNLPCSMLSYAYPVSFSFDPNAGADYYPPSVSLQPNLHLKVFNPDYITGSPGFAHSMVLRFLIVSIPTFYTSDLNLADNPTAQLYFVAFYGPIAATLSVNFALLDQVVNKMSGNVIPLDYYPVSSQAKRLKLQKAIGGAGTSAPTNTANWQTLINIDLANPPTSFNASGPLINDYLYLDNTIQNSPLDWYRAVQTISLGNNSTDIFTAPYQGNVYSEKTVFSMMDTLEPLNSNKINLITRRITLASNLPSGDPLQASPIAMFIGNSLNALSNPIQFNKGPFNFKIRAFCNDPNNYTNTYLMVRFWFQPSNEAIDLSNPHKYRDSTEFYFDTKTDSNNIILHRGIPQNVDQLIVSPALPNELSYIQLTRYMDYISGATNQTDWNAPFGTDTSGNVIQAQVVIGLYTFSYLTPDGLAATPSPLIGNITSGVSRSFLPMPQINIELNGSFGSFETTIQQILSNQGLFPIRGSRFNTATYTSMPAPMVVTHQFVNGSIASGDNTSFISYSGKYLPSSTDVVVPNAFANLLTLQPTANAGVVAGALCIPYANVSLTQNESISTYVDFSTNASSLANGRVESSSNLGNTVWEVDISFDRGVDTPIIGVEYRIEAFLATLDGTITERIFRSNILPTLNTSSNTDNSRSINIPIITPFIIGGDNTQLIIRLWIYPYSLTGQPIDISSVTKKLSPKPFGVRINSVTLQSHTLQSLTINQVSSFVGSPAFYEDLPLVPNDTFDSQQFIFDLDMNATGGASIFTFSDTPWPISGAMYSPTWIVNLPQNMEVICASGGLQSGLTDTVYFRTVLSGSTTGSTELSISAIEDKLTGKIHIVNQETPSIISDGGFTGKVIRQYSCASPFHSPYSNNIVAGNNSIELSGSLPNLCMLNLSNNTKHPAALALITQTLESNYSSFAVSINTTPGGSKNWIGPNTTLEDNNFGGIRRAIVGLTNPVMAQAHKSNLLYIAGYAPPGAIFLKQVSLFNIYREGSIADGPIYLVDGDSTVTLPSNQNFITPSVGLTGAVVQTFPGILIDSSNRITVAYVPQGQSGKIFARTSIVGNMGFSSAYPIVDLTQMGIVPSSNLILYDPVLYWYEATKTAFVAFYCGGKIFVTKINLSSKPLLSPIQLVAGDNNFANPNNSNNAYFSLMQQNGYLRNYVLGNTENDVPRQKVGFFVSEQAEYHGELFVYYVNSNNIITMRKVTIDGPTGSPIQIATINP